MNEYDVVTVFTVAKCKKCMEDDKIVAYMDIVSEWMATPGWNQTLLCKRCNREIKRWAKTSQLVLAGVFD